MKMQDETNGKPWWFLFWPRSAAGRILALLAYAACALLWVYLSRRTELMAESRVEHPDPTSQAEKASIHLVPPRDRTPPELSIVTPAPGRELTPGDNVSFELTFNEPISACTLGTSPARISGTVAKLDLHAPNGSEWTLPWRAVDLAGNATTNRTLAYSLAQDRIVSVDIDVTTGNEDKECGEFITEVFYGGASVLRRGYGSLPDGRCTTDNPREYWGPGHHENYAAQPVTSKPVVVPGSPVHVVCSLEERPGEINILWDARITIRVVTQSGRSLSFSGSKRFDTNGGNRQVDSYDMGSQGF